MRISFIFLFLILQSFVFGQSEFELWTKIEAEGDIVKHTDWNASVNTRFGNRGINTFFTQFGVEYKVKKWFRPSIEYRYILDQDRYTNFNGSHRINFNANFKKRIDRFSVNGRLRYQYAFNSIGSTVDFNPDFDQAFRAKVTGKYDINDNIFTPLVSCELFYNPEYGPLTPSFSKVRFGIGSSLELDDPHSLSFKYVFDKRLNNFSADSKHIIAVSYGYKF